MASLYHPIVQRLLAHLKLPKDALDMLLAARRFSGLTRQTVPSELLPLNARQISRGVLNFTILQASPNWVLPFWAERQYDPSDPAFIPRSHTGLSVNITHRDWTGVGNPDCPVEPIVDPRGLVTPFAGRWSVDVWFGTDHEAFFPSRAGPVAQRLVDGFPIVETRLEGSGIAMTTRCATIGPTLIQESTVENLTNRVRTIRLAVAIRPFNPEGVALIHDLHYDPGEGDWLINGADRLQLRFVPEAVLCASYDDGDCALAFGSGDRQAQKHMVHCTRGLANGVALTTVTLKPGTSATLSWDCPLHDTNARRLSETGGRRSRVRTGFPGPAPQLLSIAEAHQRWDQRLGEEPLFTTPDPGLNALLHSSEATLLMLTDGDTITPGPATYHQFWFRDAAYMLLALDRIGRHSEVRAILASYPRRQDRSGFYRSQQGEWDSNGQALWSIWQHTQLTGDPDLARAQFSSMLRGVRWIDKKRQNSREHRGTPHWGLLPPGLSAEHLGLADHYFWDNFWALAGVEAFSRICLLLGREDEERYAARLARGYRGDLETAIRGAQRRFAIEAIPASPYRSIDHGMVATCCALYPLELFPPDDPRILASLQALTEKFMHKGLFFQEFIHSGLNAYLTLQIAHAWLLAGRSDLFWTLMQAVISHASPTGTFPEAIHPLTGGGCMGDGQHGWAAAEVLLAVRDMFVQERWDRNGEGPRLQLLAGIPPAWLRPGNRFSIRGAPVAEGSLALAGSVGEGEFSIQVRMASRHDSQPWRWTIVLPVGTQDVRINGCSAAVHQGHQRGSAIELPADTEVAALTGRFTS